MNPLLLLALILLMAGMLLRLVGWILVSIVRGLWNGSRLVAVKTGRVFVRRERPVVMPGMAISQ
jgi:hypothetical protein